MNKMRMVLAVSAIVAVAVSYAHTPAETNAVLRLMLGGASTYMSFDNYNDDMPSDIPDYRRQSVFFEVYTNENWTIGEKQGVFDDYLNQLSVANRSVTNEMFRYANTAIMQCRLMKYTNAVLPLRRIAVNPYLSKLKYRDVAIEAAVRMGGVSDEATAFVEHIMTNSVRYCKSEIRDACVRYTDLLEVEPSGATVDRALKMLYRNRLNGRLAVALDMLFTLRIGGYGTSSNRLSYLSWAISDPAIGSSDWSGFRTRLSAITNRLMQLEQPLPEVESLRDVGTRPPWSDSHRLESKWEW